MKMNELEQMIAKVMGGDTQGATDDFNLLMTKRVAEKIEGMKHDIMNDKEDQ